MDILVALSAQTIIVTVLATLGVGDLYRQRQLKRYRIVVYPVRRARRAA